MKASTFLNIRKHASRRKWDHVFVTSGRFVYLAVETALGSARCRWVACEKISGVEVHAGMMIASGPAEEAAKRMKAALIAVGMLQGRVGAPKGNRNAGAENREKTKAEISAAQKAAKR